MVARPLEQKYEWMRGRQQRRQAEKEARDRRRQLSMEDRRFKNRLRFDQSTIWDWNRPPEPRSSTPSIWPALEQSLRLWGR